MLSEPRDLFLHGKKVGTIYGDAYITERDSIKHFFRLYQGYSISVLILDILKQEGVKYIRFREIGREDHTIRIYEVYTHDYDAVETVQENPKHNMTDLQKVIPLRRMKLLNTIPE